MHAHIINAQKIASIFDVGLAHINNDHTKPLHMYVHSNRSTTHINIIIHEHTNRHTV